MFHSIYFEAGLSVVIDLKFQSIYKHAHARTHTHSHTLSNRFVSSFPSVECSFFFEQMSNIRILNCKYLIMIVTVLECERFVKIHDQTCNKWVVIEMMLIDVTT